VTPPNERLSPLDASFLAVEGPTAHMHVGWAAYLDPPEDGERPDFARLAAHMAARLARAPRWHQRLADVPGRLHEPEWIDDPGYDPANHLHHAPETSLDAVAERVLSEPLRRDRPLWEMWIADRLEDGGIGVVGKAHHCMVDGAAAFELASVLLDRKPDVAESAYPAPEPPQLDPHPTRAARLRRAAAVRARDYADLARVPVRAAAQPRETLASIGSLARAALPLAPRTSLNLPGSGGRTLSMVRRPVDDFRAIKRAWGTSSNDVVLAAAAGALRRHAERRNEEPQALKVMVPVDTRGHSDRFGNQITFVFPSLPCDEPDPVARLMRVHRDSQTRKRRGDSAGTEAALALMSLTPRPLRRAAAHVVASRRMYNLAVSFIPGPRLPVYLLGCRVRAIHPVVPLANRHALSIGVCTVNRDACFGLYADRATLPDADRLADDLGGAVDELLMTI
jgi:WS/DGAT/MGAT family acyltransferase